jgi:hypothetical protein
MGRERKEWDVPPPCKPFARQTKARTILGPLRTTRIVLALPAEQKIYSTEGRSHARKPGHGSRASALERTIAI